MTDQKFTPEEVRIIKLYAGMPRGFGRRIHSWIAEIVPAIGLFGYGMYSEKRVFVLVGFGGLLFFALLRMWRQFKYAHLIQSIFSKIDIEDPTDR